MAARVPARLTPQQGRRFGVTVGGAFLVFAALAWWRGSVILTPVLTTLGAALALAGLIIPTHLGPVERAWMALAHAISRVTTPIVMAVMYFVAITPTAAMRRGFGGNPLVHGADATGFWKSRPPGSRRSRSMERQF
jgi:hypothetical protein